MKVPRKIDSGLSNQHKHNDHNTNKLQDYQFNSKADPDKIENLNIG